MSKEGIKYYRDVLDEMRSKNIEPVVTLYHWDHPEVLERMGGWTNELMVEWFADYARVVYKELGDRMPIITTINEPQKYCVDAYGSDSKAPGEKRNTNCGEMKILMEIFASSCREKLDWKGSLHVRPQHTEGSRQGLAHLRR